jgi:hypothetical protein
MVMSERSSGASNLRDKFPDLEPIHKLPQLWNIAGVGFGMYGSRDADAATGSIVKTHCFSVLGIPLAAIGAYRIAMAGDGAYFLGKQSLSSFAKAWNCLFLTCMIALGGGYFWRTYTESPEYIASQNLAKANGYLESGDEAEAARTYLEVAVGKAPRAAAKAKDALRGMLANQSFGAEPRSAAEILRVAAELQRYDSNTFDAGDLVKQGTELAEKAAPADPRNALAMLNAVLPLAEKADELTPRRLQLLETIVQNDPQDPEAASELAVIYESQSQLDKCEKLLTPHHDRLGIHEGARVLGQIFAKRGEHDKAVVLLMPYTEARLKNLHDAETALFMAVTVVRQNALEDLKTNKAPKALYERLEKANEEQQRAMLIEYVESRTKDDADVAQRQQTLERAAAVVPVALDLGISLLQKGQELAEPEARRAELEKAEKVFVSIQGLAGESDQYRLALGQVYYWLGKQKEGRELFDSLLDSNDRKVEMLLAVANTLREVGSEADSRTLSEEAYNKATERAHKESAANLRAHTPIDLDDEVVWLGRSNPASPEIKASLCKAKGAQAVRDGNVDLAVRHFEEAIAVYDAQTQTDFTLNNAAIAHFGLYRLTGDVAALDKGTEKLERALALNPGDSILVVNAAGVILEGAVRKVIGNDIDLNLLKMSGSIDLLAYLYETDSGRQTYADRILSSAGVRKAQSYMEKGLVLAPKRGRPYEMIVSIHEYTRNVAALKDLVGRIEQAKPDFSDEIRRMQKLYDGSDDDTLRKDLDATVARAEATLPAAKTKGGVTFAVAATTLANRLMAASVLRGKVDANRVVELAEQAHASAPSRATNSALVGAFCFRASHSLAGKQPAYADMLTKANRSLGHAYMLALGVARGGALKDAVLAEPDVQRCIPLLVESLTKFPEACGPWDWAMLRVGSPETQSKMEEAIKQNETQSVMLQINRLLSPASGGPMMEAYFAAKMAGDEPGAKAVLQQCKDKGIPLPFDVDKF